MDEITVAEKELRTSTKSKYRPRKVTTLTRLSIASHRQLQSFAHSRKQTMSSTLDFIIKNFMKHNKHYELD